MTKIKLCGLSRPCDMEAANDVMPEYVGFVFAPESRRRITPEAALKLREQLSPAIQAVGVFVNEMCIRDSPKRVRDPLRCATPGISQFSGRFVIM